MIRRGTLMGLLLMVASALALLTLLPTNSPDASAQTQLTCAFLDSAPYTVGEGETYTVKVRLTRPIGHDIRVGVTAGGGSAVAGSDFIYTEPWISIPAGATSGTTSIDTIWRSGAGDKTTLLAISGFQPGDGRVAACENAGKTLTIEEAPPTTARVTGRAPLDPWFEGNSLTFGVFVWPVQRFAMTVKVRVTDASGSSSFLAPGEAKVHEIRLEPNAIGAHFRVKTVNDSTDEADGYVTAEVIANADAGYRPATDGRQSRGIKVSDDDGASSFSSTMTLGAPDDTTISEGPNRQYERPSGTSPDGHGNVANMELSSTGSFEQALVRLYLEVGGSARYGRDYILQAWDPGKTHWYDLYQLTNRPEQVKWVVFQRGSWVRAVALSDRVTDANETITIRVVDWSMTKRIHPGATVNLSQNQLHTITIDTDVEPLSGSPPEPESEGVPNSESGLISGQGQSNSEPSTQPPADHPLVKYADLISDIKTDYIVDHDDANAHPKWKRVLKAFGEPGYLNYHLDAMTSEEAQDLYDDNGWARWEPIGDALAYTEQYGTTTSGEPEADSQQDSQQTQQGQQQSTDQQEASEDDDALPSDHPLVVYATLIADIHNTYIVDHDTASAHPRW